MTVEGRLKGRLGDSRREAEGESGRVGDSGREAEGETG